MNLPLWLQRKPLRMLWRVEKDGRASHIVGTAHFFPYSFRHAFLRLMQRVQTVLFEGPLDEASSASIAEYGRNGQGTPALVDALTPEAIQEIERLLHDRLDGQNGEAWYLSLLGTKPVYVEMFTQGVRPWAAFFSIWQTYLGWEYSMDLEAYRLACKLGKQVLALESLEEQLAVLDGIPLERIVRQLNDVKNWKAYKTEYVRTFLEGDLERMITLSSRFATRGPTIVGRRDQVFFEHLQPVFESEDALAFLGFPHIPGVARLFHEAGYRVTQGSV